MTGPGSIDITVQHEVAFYDVDSYRVVWHGSYVKYLEITRCQLLESIGYTYHDMEQSGYFFPVVDLRIKYVQPLQFGQLFFIHAQLEEWEHRLKIRYLLTDTDGNVVTRASTTQVAVAMPDQIMQLASPDILIEKVRHALAQR